MSEPRETDVLFPWEIERVRRSAEAEAAQPVDQAGDSTEDVASDEQPTSDAEPDAVADTAADQASASPAHVPTTAEATAAGGGGQDGSQAEAPETADAAAATAGPVPVEQELAGSGGVGAEAALGAGEERAGQTPREPDTAARAEGVDDAQRSGGPNATGADAATHAEHAEDDRFAVLDTAFARRAAERASAALRDKPIAQKEYYSISEVCELTGLKPHVLRYWEAQFHVLNPSKNRSGNRVYQRKEIRLIMLVKHLLYEEKYTVEGAKAKLEQLRRGRELTDATGVVLDRSMVEQLRADLSELATLLTPPTHA